MFLEANTFCFLLSLHVALFVLLIVLLSVMSDYNAIFEMPTNHKSDMVMEQKKRNFKKVNHSKCGFLWFTKFSCSGYRERSKLLKVSQFNFSFLSTHGAFFFLYPSRNEYSLSWRGVQRAKSHLKTMICF